MKYLKYSCLLLPLALASCKKVIDLYPQSNPNSDTYYTTLDEVKTGLTGSYNGLRLPLATEWQLTELRSDNARMGVPASTASFNRDLSDLDMFIPATTHQAVYNYWQTTYGNIRNTNIILDRLGVNYDPAAGAINLGSFSIPMSETDRKQLAGEALFIRAYHYFNLVRLYGGVFLVHEPILAAQAKSMNRSSVADIYKLIEADLKTATTFASSLKFSQIAAANRGRANAWSAKGLLGKVYLTQNKKAEAITQLQDVVSNSGYGLESTYANVFSINNEMNKEILFAVRYKSGGLGLGSTFGNDFAPLNSGSNVINGSGDGWNQPTFQLDTSYASNDAREAVTIATFGSGNNAQLYVKKYLNPVVIADDGEADWPVLRYADVLLMLAEAKGLSAESIGLINQVRARAGLPALSTSISSVAVFEEALQKERRLEFAFENQRFFDLVRYNTTLSTITAEQKLKEHFAAEYAVHYSRYVAPTPSLAELQGNVRRERLLLPIPQREIDTNTGLVIAQNPGY